MPARTLVSKVVDCKIPTSVGEGNEAFFIRIVWKMLPSVRFKNLE